MKGDFSRLTFDPTKHYTRVLMQQGRVQLDADWNEQQAIHQHRIESEARDVIGRSGGPANDLGFEIAVAPNGKTVGIGKGRYYVDGILCENENDLAYAGQTDVPNAPEVIALLTGAGTTFGLAYLDVWQRHVTALDDARIREVALDGPDTMTRAKTVWQVKILPVKPTGTQVPRGDDAFPEWDTLTGASTGGLSARARPQAGVDNPCLLPPSAGYRGLENQLYRVEVHAPGPLGTATFKWSRDNGANVTTIEKISGQELTVHHVGPDEVLGFSDGQWVELLSDVEELNGSPGQLIQIDSVNAATRVVRLKSAPSAVDVTRNPKLRRWDNVGVLKVEKPTTNDGWIPLEDGVEVAFAEGSYQTGDYWVIPARTTTAGIEWPFDAPQLPAGIRHHHARLALLRLDTNAGTLGVVGDCRRPFLPLAEMPAALHVLGINWVNDDVVKFDDFARDGLQIVLDGAPAKESLSTSSMIVTMELPLLASTDAHATRPVVSALLTTNDKDVSVDAGTVTWKPKLEELGVVALLTGQTAARIRVRLMGHAIWGDLGDRRAYLDGQVFGQGGLRGDNTPRTDLVFPSGAGSAASDFESWFFMVPQTPPVSMQSFTLGTNKVVAGGSVTGTITLTSPAPGAGLVVNLASKDASATVPAQVTVPPGQTTGTFEVKTSAQATPGSKPVILEASLTVGDVPQALQQLLMVQVVSVTVSPASVTLFIGSSQQFGANVVGTDDTRVTWRVGESGGGTISATGAYVAPSQVGTFHVIAISTADPTKTGVATIVVRNKIKEKDKDKNEVIEKVNIKAEIDKPNIKAKEKDQIDGPKIPHKNIIDAGPIGQPGILGPVVLDANLDLGNDHTPAIGRAFIRPDERPAVGTQAVQGG